MEYLKPIKEFKGTQGEWFASTSLEVISMPEQIKIVNSVSGSSYEEAQKNAQLIGASFDLLKACIEAKKMCDDWLIPTERQLEDMSKNLGMAINKAISTKDYKKS